MATTNSSAAAKVADKAKDAFDKLYKTGFKQTVIVSLVLVAIVIIVVVILYIVSRVNATKLKQVVLHTNVIQQDNAKEAPVVIKSDVMTMVTAGHEFSYSFWIYLGSNYASTSGHKPLILRGRNAGTASTNADSNTNPIFFLDKNTNKLYVALATNRVVGNNMTLDDVLARDSNGKYTSGFIVSYIDYLPLQRWVHVMITVRDNSGYLFMDGDMYSVVTVNDLVMSGTNRPIIKGTSGDLTIGNIMHNTPGFISQTSYFNYALTQNEIKSLYARGPYPKTLLSYLGLGSYGIRAPVYKLNA